MSATMTAEPKLPPVEALRTQRSIKKAPTNHPYSVLEAAKYYTGLDRDLIWGPFYKRFRAVRKETANWTGFSLGTIWAGIPAASQTRPGRIWRLFNYLVGADPAPKITAAPRSKRSRKSAPPPSPKDQDVWQSVTDFTEDWSPSQIDFTSWYGRLKHPADYDDDFYTSNYKALYNRLCDFAEQWFGGGIYLEDWRDRDEEISTWEVPMSEQFIQYARTVAHEDKGYVNWRDIINDPRHRKWLCVSIFSQIIEKKIFQQLLFGASEPYQKELDRHDSYWVLQEGFSRKEGRCQIARAALGGRLVPENFWGSVDDLAGQTVLIFQPLFMLMCMATRRAANSAGAAFWQEVHTLLAMAGYFQVCTAISPSVFHILSATPGVRFQWEEEEHADQKIYDASKSFHRSHEDRWRVLAELSAKSDSAKVTKLTEPEDVDSTLYMPFPTSENEYRMMDHQRRRGGKVMYAVFPKLTRYTAENIGNIILDVKPATSQNDQEASEGMRISLLSRCMVVYYQGLVHDDSVWADGIPLDEHLHEIALDNLSLSFLPYWRRYWNDNGSPRLWPHWPVWPESVDKFWLGLLIYLVIRSVLVTQLGPYEYREDRRFFEAYLFRPMLAILLDVFIYILIRLFEVPLFDGRYIFLKTQGFYILFALVTEILLKTQGRNIMLFSYFAYPFIWLDQVFIHKFPNYVMSAAGALRNEDVSSIAGRALGMLKAANGT
ncbi:hypothetical protein F4803DRAFT_560553 [Xylaria telfairii]|nr:hypothetical protein F4803DRAFT_560553 [Xylaria telfairii]